MSYKICVSGAAFLALLAAGAGPAEATVTFRDIAGDGGAGIEYRRQPSVTNAQAEQIRALGTVTMDDLVGHYPIKPRGVPGVALLDHDGDGDLDIYVTNGPGAANSLYSSQLADSGELAFVDVAVAAGVAAVDQDSTGVCYGDIDNDGDPDLYVLGRGEPNRLFENLGGGVFRDITAASGAGGGSFSSQGCSMGDVDGDSLLDIAVVNTFDMASSLPIFVEPYALNQHNQLFLNLGGNSFAEVGEAAGLHPPQPEISWALALVDLDQDGDVDLLTANDNGGLPFASMGGVDRGLPRYLVNDGGGRFTDVTDAVGLHKPGDHMGVAVADFDQNGTLDFFTSNSGDYFEAFFGLPIEVGDEASRWFLQNPDGTFSDPGVGPDTVASPFGWGSAAFDYDNDGDTDIVFYGGLDAGLFVELSNPGALLRNEGGARFVLDRQALASSVDHALRVDHGLAVGDLDGNGFPDIVSASNFNVPAQEGAPVAPVPYPLDFGSVFDGLALLFPTFLATGTPGEFAFSGVEFANGTLAVEINSGDNGNGWVAVDLMGTAGLTTGGRANRDGIGAVVRFQPLADGGGAAGGPVLRPVMGGSSYASQNSLTSHFGLGGAHRGVVDVLWPGGTRNRLYNVRSGQRVLFPEIPCGIDDPDLGLLPYAVCVLDALDELVDAGVLNRRQRARFLLSAVTAFRGE